MRCNWEWMELDAIGNGWNEMQLGMDGMRYKWEWMEEDANGNGFGTSWDGFFSVLPPSL